MDYTLAEYISPHFDILAFDLAKVPIEEYILPHFDTLTFNLAKVSKEEVSIMHISIMHGVSQPEIYLFIWTLIFFEKL